MQIVDQENHYVCYTHKTRLKTERKDNIIFIHCCPNCISKKDTVNISPEKQFKLNCQLCSSFRYALHLDTMVCSYESDEMKKERPDTFIPEVPFYALENCPKLYS